MRSDHAESAPRRKRGEFYGAAVRGKLGDGRNKVMSLLWTKEGKYWKIVAIRIGDGIDAGITPKATAAAPTPPEAEPKTISGDPKAVKDITSFYESWIGKRDPAEAVRYVSERSYQCLAAPCETDKADEACGPSTEGIDESTRKVPQGQNLSDMMSSVQPVNDLVRSVEQKKLECVCHYGSAQPDGRQFPLPKPQAAGKDARTET